jgi:sulfite reductase (ferredoxin)
VKFLVQKLGVDEFRRLVDEERKIMPADPLWDQHYATIEKFDERPAWQGVQLNGVRRPEGFDAWAATNVYEQRQPGYVVATVTCPLGDLTPDQFRALAEISKRYAGGSCRLTVDQNLVLRWVPHNKAVDLYNELKKLGLAEAHAGTIVDVTSCPGTDTCKLGIASSRGLAGELRERLASKSATLDEAVKGLRIKVSGCFNSCGQHHVADIGFYGNSRNVGNYTVPHFQVMLGGKWRENGGSYALAMGAVPSKRIPDLVAALTDRYTNERTGDETFQQWAQRVGKKDLKATIEPFVPVPPRAQDASMFSDWGDPREFTIGDLGMGECAGEVVSLQQFGFSQAESEAFEASLALDAGEYKRADDLAYQAMLTAAKTLVQIQYLDVPDDANTVVNEFKTRFVDTQLFWDKYHADQFSRYLFVRHEGPDARYTKDTAHKLVEEANLFIDAAHKCNAKVQAQMQNLIAPAAAAK